MSTLFLKVAHLYSSANRISLIPVVARCLSCVTVVQVSDRRGLVDVRIESSALDGMRVH